MSPAPHICHIFSTFAPGGLELRTANTINALGERFRHTIIALDGNFASAERIGRGVDVQLADPPRRVRFLYGLALRSAVRRVAPDLLVTYNFGAIHGLIGGWLGRLCPIIHVEAGFQLEEATSLDWRWVLARRLLLNRIQATIVPSKSLREVALTRYRLPSEKVIHIPNGVDVTKFRPGRDLVWRRSHGLPDEAIVFGTVARLRAEKNLSLLLRAFGRATAPRARLVIAGEGPQRAEWQALVQQLGLNERVLFAGQTHDPASWYAAFDVFVMSSATEQMPNALLEAMACGLPAICTDAGDTREMLESRNGPFIVPLGDETRYAAALATLTGCGELRAVIGAANRARCLERYSLDDMVQRYAAVYNAAIERAAPDHPELAAPERSS
jgi:glycosyltransferase involved in cell wall biosynthesis